MQNTKIITEAQKKLIELDKKKEEVKKFFDDYNAAIEAVVAESGVGHFFQDEDGTVYKTIVPEGKFVHFQKYDVNRTRRAGEVKGSLSMKEAVEAGFFLPETKPKKID